MRSSDLLVADAPVVSEQRARLGPVPQLRHGQDVVRVLGVR
jgi:hypothetical protein